MCVQYMKIKARNEYAPKIAFVPCGKCEECRQSANSQWFFRLRSELDWCRKNKWYIGFFTLTYSEDKIPRLPEEFVKNFDKVSEKGLPYCFSRYHVRTFIDNIRKRLHETYGISGIKYMICSEFGSDPDRTQRSHYHGLICFPSTYESVDRTTGEVTRCKFEPRDMFNMVHSQWEHHGFVFPRYFEGGVDRQGYEHKPFLLTTDISNAARYAAKYTCKDLGYNDHLLSYGVDLKDKALKDFKPFHIQSRSIGLGFLAQKSPQELLNILRHGVDFIGDKYRRNVPLYIRNKILYTPSYSFSPCPNGDWFYDFIEDKWHFKKGEGTHRRMVGKEATQFFHDHIGEVFQMKKEYYAELFRQMSRKDFWIANGIPEEHHRNQAISHVLAVNNPELVAEYYLAYYGLPYDKCYDVPREQMYLSRFVKNFRWSDIYGAPDLIDVGDHIALINEVSYFIESLKWSQRYNLEHRAKVKRVSDFYKHAV